MKCGRECGRRGWQQIASQSDAAAPSLWHSKSSMQAGKRRWKCETSQRVLPCDCVNAVTGKIKLALPAGKANPSPPVGPALGSKVCSLCAIAHVSAEHPRRGVQGGLWPSMDSSPDGCCSECRV